MKFLKFLHKQTERGYKILKFLAARRFGLQAAERRFEIFKFLGARRFGLRTAAEFLNLTSVPPRNRSKILKFTPKLRNGFGILKFTRTSERLADTAQNFISKCGFKILKLIHEPPSALRDALTRALRCTSLRADKAEAWCVARLTSQHTYDAVEKWRAVKFNHASGLDSAQRRIARLRSTAARHGYEVGRAEKLSKFGLTNALLNFISLLLRKFKLALLKFAREVPRNRSEILNFMFASYKLRLALRKFTPAPRKFKPAPAVRLNFALNSIPHARAAKFENGVKFKDAAKFKRGAR